MYFKNRKRFQGCWILIYFELKTHFVSDPGLCPKSRMSKLLKRKSYEQKSAVHRKACPSEDLEETRNTDLSLTDIFIGSCVQTSAVHQNVRPCADERRKERKRFLSGFATPATLNHLNHHHFIRGFICAESKQNKAVSICTIGKKYSPCSFWSLPLTLPI